MGLEHKDVSDSKAVVYQLPPDFPFDPKTVVAFRGTSADPEDAITDHDQALGLRTRQYDGAVNLGKQMRWFGIEAEVTGHSLGGGKAQAAGVAGGYTGQMFNSAGLHPRTVGLTPEALPPHADKFLQYRAEGGLAQGYGDPLTGTQNSLPMQKAVLGIVDGASGLLGANLWAVKELGLPDPLAKVPQAFQDLARQMTDRVLNVTAQEARRNFALSGGRWYIPPALGEVRGLASRNLDGSESSIPAQHSIVNLVNGFEHRKAGDINTLLARTDMPGPASHYIGPLQ